MRTATILVLIQICTIVGGTMFVAAMLKLHGYPASDTWIYNSRSVFIRNYGLSLLAIPLFWLGVAIWANDPAKHPMSANIVTLVGFLLIFVGIIYYAILGFACAFVAFTGIH